MKDYTSKEHWNLQDGKLLGVYSVDPTKAQGVDIWQKFDEVIAAYTRLHPTEMELHIREVAAIRKNRLNEFASNKDHSMRWGCSIPAALMFKLELVEPELFANTPRGKRIFNQFLRKYKGFRVCNIV